jgi:dihydrodipicolinate synthase/N-acetylneuraminate lyase
MAHRPGQAWDRLLATAFGGGNERHRRRRHHRRVGDHYRRGSHAAGRARASAPERARGSLIVGAGTSSTAPPVERARRLSAAGVDGLLVVTPAYNKPTQEGLYPAFRGSGRRLQRPGGALQRAVAHRGGPAAGDCGALVKLPRIVAVKEAVATMERVRELVALTGPGSLRCCRATMRVPLRRCSMAREE